MVVSQDDRGRKKELLPTVELVRQIYENFENGNIPGILNNLAEDVTWYDPGYPDVPYAGLKHGRAEVAEFFEQLLASSTFTKFEVKRFIGEGNEVVALGRIEGNAKKTGKYFESDWSMTWSFENNKVKNFQCYMDTVNLARAHADRETRGQQLSMY